MLPNIELIQTNGLSYLLFKNNDLISGAMKRGGFELDLQKVTDNLLKDVNDGVVIDVGANLGAYTVPIAKKNPNLQFHSFEPQRIIYYQLCANILLNHLENVYTHRLCLSDHQWSKEMAVPNYVDELNIGAFSVDTDVRNQGYEVTTSDRTEVFNAIRLDDLDLKNVKLIKIDVEGHELEVLNGATQTIINNDYPPILFESWTWKFPKKREKLFDYIESLGYKIINMGENNLARKEKTNGA